VRASWPDEQVHETTVGELAATIAATGATRTVLVLVGDALAGPPGAGVPPTSKAGRSRLYAPEFAHAFRRRSAPGTTTGRPGSGVSPKGTA
jgi:precorrin-4/cobalt-precorrin-4 C11-methyltransferase